MTENNLHLLNPPKKEKLHEGIVSQIKNLIYSHKLGGVEKLPSERERIDLITGHMDPLKRAIEP